MGDEEATVDTGATTQQQPKEKGRKWREMKAELSALKGEIVSLRDSLKPPPTTPQNTPIADSQPVPSGDGSSAKTASDQATEEANKTETKAPTQSSRLQFVARPTRRKKA